MMSLLSRHLEQIQACSESIATLPFPPPQIFTNALLSRHDITALIRDTEPHERALFSVPPPPPRDSAPVAEDKPATSRRQTVFAVQDGSIAASIAPGARSAGPRRNTAVAAVLGSELNSDIKRNEREGLGKGEMDVEVLLRGAEKLLDVYAVDGAERRIAALRQRYKRVREGVRFYGEKVERQREELEGMNRGWEGEGEDDEHEEDDEDAVSAGIMVTEEDLRAEEMEIRELERKKRELEERVSGMERDLGGLLR